MLGTDQDRPEARPESAVATAATPGGTWSAGPALGTPAIALGVVGLALGMRDRRFLLLPAAIAARALWRTVSSTAMRPTRPLADVSHVTSAVATDLALADRNDRYAG